MLLTYGKDMGRPKLEQEKEAIKVVQLWCNGRRIKICAPIGNLYKKIVMDVFQSEHKHGSDDRKLIAAQIDEQERILSNARKTFMTENIDAGDFKAIKSECTEALRILEAKLADTPNKADSLNTTLEVILQIDKKLCVKNKGERYTNLHISL